MTTILMSEKDALNRAFKTMRRHGFVARQSFSCCGGCGGGEIARDVGDMPEKRRSRVKGAVFFTRQAWNGLFQQYPGRRGPKELYVNFGQVRTTAGDVGLPDLEVGLALGMALQAEGLDAEWDGTEASCVKVTFK